MSLLNKNRGLPEALIVLSSIVCLQAIAYGDWKQSNFPSTTLKGVRVASEFPGPDMGEKINAAIADLGTCAYPTGITDAGCGGTVYIPAGQWTISTPIQVTNGIRLRGAGRMATVLKAANGLNHSVILIGVNAAETGVKTAGTQYAGIYDLTIDGNAINQTSTSHGIHLGSVSRCEIEHIRVQNVRTHSILADNGSLSAPGSVNNGLLYLDDISIVAAQSGFAQDAYGTDPVGIYFWGTYDWIITRLEYNDLNSARHVSYAAIYIRASGSGRLINNYLTGGHTGGAIIVDGGFNNLTFAENHIDHNLLGILVYAAPLGAYNSILQILGNDIQCNYPGAGANCAGGIAVLGSSKNTLIANNTVTNNAATNAYGLYASPNGSFTGTVFAIGNDFNAAGTGLPVDDAGKHVTLVAQPVNGVVNNSRLASPHANVIVSNGANNNLAIGNARYIYLTGPTAAFSVTGFAGGADGAELIVQNATSQAFTISNQNTGSDAANRICTFTGADVVLSGALGGTATFSYDKVDSVWILRSHNP